MTFIDEILNNGPGDVQQRIVLLALAAAANEDCQVALSPLQLKDRTTLSERTVVRSIQRLEEDHWLLRLDKGGWEILLPRVRARDPRAGARLWNKPLTNTDGFNPAERSELPVVMRAREARQISSSSPKGTGSRQSLGIENCPECGGTGWMEVDSVENGHPTGNFTVDVCSCRGGPSPRPTSVTPTPEPPHKGLTGQQAMTNLLGAMAARKELRADEAEA